MTVALITGGSKGIGPSELFVSKGYQVIMFKR